MDLGVWPKETLYQGQPAFLFFAVDVTETKALREQALHIRKMEAVGTLVAGIAHQFNNLLAVALGFTEMLLSEKDEGDPDYADLTRIAAACSRGAELVKKLRFLGKRADNQFETLDLNREINETVDLLSRSLPANIALDLKLDGSIRQVRADSIQVAQLVVNLILNAVDAMPGGGNLTIETRNCAVNAEYCRTHMGAEAGDYVQLSVTDTGHGIDEDTLSRIFEPFFTTRGMANRCGLGLAVVHGIIEEHGGHIACESAVGAGATFLIYLPAMPELAVVEGVPEAEEVRGGTETILVVDDEDLVRDLVAEILEKMGYSVVMACDGRQALELYSMQPRSISLILLDLVMPHMDGKKCLENLLKTDPRARVLITTGYAERTDKEELMEAGAKGFLIKPFEVPQFLRTIRQILDQD